MSPRAYAALIFVGVVWGTSFLYIRVAVDAGVPPLQVVFFRGLGGSIALVVLARARRSPIGLDRRRLGYAGFLAVVATVAPFALIAWAEKDVPSGPASVLNATQPLFVIVLAAVFIPEERLRFRRALGVTIGLCGVLILVGGGVRDLAGSNLIGQLAIVVAIWLYSVGNIITRSVLRAWEPLPLSVVQITLTALVAGALAVPFGGLKLDVSWTVWLALLALGVLGTGLAYFAYFWLIERVGSVQSSVVTYVIPIVGVAAGAVVLGESVAWNTFVGGAVILLGVAIVNGLGERFATDRGLRRQAG